MVENFKNPEIIGTISTLSSEKRDYKSRFAHALLYKIDGESVYTFDREKIRIGAGAVLYIPQGASYTVQKTSAGESRYCLINFYMELSGEVYPKLVGGWSDSCLVAENNVPVICAMGVKGENNHSPQEYALVETMFERAKLAIASILTL